MADGTNIEWAHAGLGRGASWNPIKARRRDNGAIGWHCEKVSPGCANCYSEALNEQRFGTKLPYKPGHRADVEIYLDEKTLMQPLSWRAPRGIFVCSTTDVFGEFVTDEWIDRVFAIMALCPQHTFQVLTKRPKRMREYFRDMPRVGGLQTYKVRQLQTVDDMVPMRTDESRAAIDRIVGLEPLPNVFLGVTAEDQERADERIPDLLATPAAVRFVSIEPLLGPVDLTRIRYQLARESYAIMSALEADDGFGLNAARNRLDWVICGGESGPNARPMHPDWLRSLRDQCVAAGVAFFFKHWGRWMIGEPSMAVSDENPFGLPLRFADGDEFHVVSDGHDIVLCAAEDARAPKRIWRDYWADGHGHLAKNAEKSCAGRLLDGREWNEFPEAANG